MPKLVHLPGTTLEGGGQLLRIAIGVSALTGVHVRISDIRGNRSGGGGLKMQHLTSVKWLASICDAYTLGAKLKSRDVVFRPNQKRKDVLEYHVERTLSNGNRVLDIQINQTTPGSVGLVLQAILPTLIFSGGSLPIRLTISGGTNTSNSPSYDYISQVLLPTLAQIGAPPIDVQLNARGWSQGSVKLGGLTFNITPLEAGKCFQAFTMSSRGDIARLSATILAHKSLESQCRVALEKILPKYFSNIPVDLTFEESHHHKRLYLLLVAHSSNGYVLGRDWLFDERIKDENEAILKLTNQVAGELKSEIQHGGCVDEYMRDQLVVFQALAKGFSTINCGGINGKHVRASLHARTAEWVCSEILPAVQFDGRGGCQGIGFVAGDVAVRKGTDQIVEDLADDIEHGIAIN